MESFPGDALDRYEPTSPPAPTPEPMLMGEKKVDVTATRPRPGVPRLHIRVVGMMGEVRIRTG